MLAWAAEPGSETSPMPGSRTVRLFPCLIPTHTMSKLPKYSLSNIEFETEAKDAKGALTEDSGLKILADLAKTNRKQIRVIERASPAEVGEFDAILCTDSGLIVVELKRLGGCFQEFGLLDPRVRIQSGRQERSIPNPSARLHEKSKRLVQECLGKEEWAGVRRLFSGRIPVANIVCYGPSTMFEVQPESINGNHICNTRILSRTILDIFTSRPAVIGAGAHMASLASTWVQWGMLTTNQKGFLRCSLSGITSSVHDASTWGLQSLQSDGQNLALAYEDGRKAKLPFDGEVRLKAYVDGSERSVHVEPGSRFRWRVKGR